MDPSAVRGVSQELPNLSKVTNGLRHLRLAHDPTTPADTGEVGAQCAGIDAPFIQEAGALRVPVTRLTVCGEAPVSAAGPPASSRGGRCIAVGEQDELRWG